jgi:hypothetical protein
MWPHLFGQGWVGDALLSAGLLAGILIAIAVLSAGTRQPAGRAEAAHDWLQTVWHRYEQGDLTPWEFERLVTSPPAPVSRYAARADRAMPADDALAAQDAAAD